MPCNDGYIRLRLSRPGRSVRPGSPLEFDCHYRMIGRSRSQTRRSYPRIRASLGSWSAIRTSPIRRSSTSSLVLSPLLLINPRTNISTTVYIVADGPSFYQAVTSDFLLGLPRGPNNEPADLFFSGVADRVPGSTAFPFGSFGCGDEGVDGVNNVAVAIEVRAGAHGDVATAPRPQSVIRGRMKDL